MFKSILDIKKLLSLGIAIEKAFEDGFIVVDSRERCLEFNDINNTDDLISFYDCKHDVDDLLDILIFVEDIISQKRIDMDELIIKKYKPELWR